MLGIRVFRIPGSKGHPDRELLEDSGLDLGDNIAIRRFALALIFASFPCRGFEEAHLRSGRAGVDERRLLIACELFQTEHALDHPAYAAGLVLILHVESMDDLIGIEREVIVGILQAAIELELGFVPAEPIADRAFPDIELDTHLDDVATRELAVVELVQGLGRDSLEGEAEF